MTFTDKQIFEAIEANVFLARAYMSMFIIQLRIGEHSELLNGYKKYVGKPNNNCVVVFDGSGT